MAKRTATIGFIAFGHKYWILQAINNDIKIEYIYNKIKEIFDNFNGLIKDTIDIQDIMTAFNCNALVAYKVIKKLVNNGYLVEKND